MALVLLAGDMNMNGGLSATAQTLVTIGGVPVEVHGSIVSTHPSSTSRSRSRNWKLQQLLLLLN